MGFGRAWGAGVGVRDGIIVETDVLADQCGAKFTYNHVRGYQRLFSVIAGTGDVVRSRLRGGNADAGCGAASSGPRPLAGSTTPVSPAGSVAL